MSQPEELASLAEEIALARTLTERAVRLYDKVVIDPPEGYKPPEKMVVSATENLKEALSHVSMLVEKHARVSALMQDKIPVGQLTYFTTAVARIIADEVGDDEALQKKIIDRIEAIKLPDDKNDPNVLLMGE